MGRSSSSDLIELEGLPAPVRLKPSARARRFTLRLPAHEETPVLTLPPGVPDAEVRRFLLRHSKWLKTAIDRRPEMVHLRPGARMPIAGEWLEITIADKGPDHPEIEDGRIVFRGADALGRRARAFLRERARADLLPAATRYARALDREVSSIALRDTTTRWGSCSARGTLSFSWRLAMAPPAVLDYVAAHEAAHLVEMNHGPRFWALVDRLCPEHQTHRAWLRGEGRVLHRIVFD